MPLFDEVKQVLHISHSKSDAEIQMNIEAALADMRRVGIKEELLDEEELNPLVKQAITCWCKANYGYDNKEAERFEESYERLVSSLLNSKANEVYDEVE